MTGKSKEGERAKKMKIFLPGIKKGLSLQSQKK